MLLGGNVSRKLSKIQIDKLGNSLIFFIDGISDPYKTKLLKLIYLLDLYSVREFGIPVIGLDYKTWKLGPVDVDLYAELTNETILLSEYIGYGSSEKIVAKRKFSDLNFSENDVEMLNYVIGRFRTTKASELIDHTHRKGGPWDNVVQKNNLAHGFENGEINTTDFSVNLADIAEEDLKDVYEDYQEFLQISKALST